MDSSSFEMITAKSSTPFREKYFSLPSSLLHTGQRPSCPYHLSTQGVQPSSRWQQPETVIGRAILKQIQHLKFSLMLVDSMLLLWHTSNPKALSLVYIFCFSLCSYPLFFFLLVIREGNCVDFFAGTFQKSSPWKKGKKIHFQTIDMSIFTFLIALYSSFTFTALCYASLVSCVSPKK